MDIVPKKIIIVPYRNRENHKIFFMKHMNDYFENEDKIEMYFVHQMDNRCFNRGGMKNIGFLAMKKNILITIKTLHLSFMILIPFLEIKVF